MLTTEYIAELTRAGFTPEQIEKAVFCFDTVIQNYNVARKEVNLVEYNSRNVNKNYYDLYIASREFQGYAKGTMNNIKVWLGKFIGELNVSVCDVQPMHIRLFLAKHQIKKNGQQMTKSSLEKIKQIISSFYGWLVQERQVTYNPASNIQGMRTQFKYQGALTSEEVAKLKFACKDARESLMVEFLVSTGCRIAELVNIKLQDIDMQQQSVKILGKGNKERIAYFSSESKLLIYKYLETRGIEYERYLRELRNGKTQTKYLLVHYGTTETALSTSRARAAIISIYSRVSDSIHLEKLTPHTFRRTFAMLTLRRGMALEIVSKLLGHANLQTTMRYLEIDQTELKAQHFRLVA